MAWLLRTWREHVAGRSQRTVARALGVSESALSMWEGGRRRPGLGQLVALDRSYGADGALVDLAMSLGTPDGLPARHIWAHNPPGPSRPHWAWLRPAPPSGKVEASLQWGAFRMLCSEVADDRGLFVTTSASMPNPAAWVYLAAPGWVDFGRGRIPRELGIPTRDALSAARVSACGHSAAGLVGDQLVDRYMADVGFAEKVRQFFGDRPDLVNRVFTTREGWTKVAHVHTAASQPDHRCFSGAQYRQLRQARGLSQAEVAELATSLLPGHVVKADQIRGIEQGRTPRAAFIHSRLDTVYFADGYTCMERVSPAEVMRVSSSEARHSYAFPRYWIGPVWLTFRPRGRSAQARIRLIWDDGTKDLFVTGSATITCRRPVHDAGPLHVHCPTGWTITAGLGQCSDARDVNFGWRRSDHTDPSRSISPNAVNAIFLSWFDRTEAEFAAFLRDNPA